MYACSVPTIKLAICSRHFNSRHKEVKFAQNRASPLRARHRIIRGVVERRYYANMCSRGAVHAGVATFISVSAPGFSKKYLSLSSNKAFPTKLAFEKR